jgi:small subunit ribosomal protein S17
MNERRRLNGVVTSDKMTNTVVVEVTRAYRHPLYKKVIYSKKRHMVHDELGSHVGDEVRIVESRPLSRTKRWVVEEIIKRSIGGEDVLIDILAEEAAE